MAIGETAEGRKLAAVPVVPQRTEANTSAGIAKEVAWRAVTICNLSRPTGAHNWGRRHEIHQVS
jgi:hypothetical protein